MDKSILNYKEEFNKNKAPNDSPPSFIAVNPNLIRDQKILFFNTMFKIYEAEVEEIESTKFIPVYIIQYVFLLTDKTNIDKQLNQLIYDKTLESFTLKKYGYFYNEDHTILSIVYYKTNYSFINQNLFCTFEETNYELVYLEVIRMLIDVVEYLHSKNKFMFFIHPHLLFYNSKIQTEFYKNNPEEAWQWGISHENIMIDINTELNRNEESKKAAISKILHTLTKVQPFVFYDNILSEILMQKWNVWANSNVQNQHKHNSNINKTIIEYFDSIKLNGLKLSRVKLNSVYGKDLKVEENYVNELMLKEYISTNNNILNCNEFNETNNAFENLSQNFGVLNFFFVFYEKNIIQFRNNPELFKKIDILSILMMTAYYFKEKSFSERNKTYEKTLAAYMKDYFTNDKTFINTFKDIENKSIVEFLSNNLNLDLSSLPNIDDLKFSFYKSYSEIYSQEKCADCFIVEKDQSNVFDLKNWINRKTHSEKPGNKHPLFSNRNNSEEKDNKNINKKIKDSSSSNDIDSIFKLDIGSSSVRQTTLDNPKSGNENESGSNKNKDAIASSIKNSMINELINQDDDQGEKRNNKIRISAINKSQTNKALIKDEDNIKKKENLEEEPKIKIQLDDNTISKCQDKTIIPMKKPKIYSNKLTKRLNPVCFKLLCYDCFSHHNCLVCRLAQKLELNQMISNKFEQINNLRLSILYTEDLKKQELINTANSNITPKIKDINFYHEYFENKIIVNQININYLITNLTNYFNFRKIEIEEKLKKLLDEHRKKQQLLNLKGKAGNNKISLVNNSAKNQSNEESPEVIKKSILELEVKISSLNEEYYYFIERLEERISYCNSINLNSSMEKLKHVTAIYIKKIKMLTTSGVLHVGKNIRKLLYNYFETANRNKYIEESSLVLLNKKYKGTIEDRFNFKLDTDKFNNRSIQQFRSTLYNSLVYSDYKDMDHSKKIEMINTLISRFSVYYKDSEIIMPYHRFVSYLNINKNLIAVFDFKLNTPRVLRPVLSETSKKAIYDNSKTDIKEFKFLDGCKYINMKNKVVITGGTEEVIQEILVKRDLTKINSLLNNKQEKVIKKIYTPQKLAYYILYEENSSNIVGNINNKKETTRFNHNDLNVSDFSEKPSQLSVNKSKIYNDIIENRSIHYLPKMTYARDKHSMIQLNDFVFAVVAGLNTNTCEKFNFFTNKWERLPNLSKPKANTSLCLVNKIELYCFFGSINIGSTEKINEKNINEVERLKLYCQNSNWESIIFKNPSNIDLYRCLVGIIKTNTEEIILVGGKYDGKNSSDQCLKFNRDTFTFSLDSDKLSKGMFFNESEFSRISKSEFVCFNAETKASLVRLNY